MSEGLGAVAQLSLKSSVFFGRSEDGAVFRGGGAPVILRGKKAYELARAIIQGLNQGVALPTLLGKFPDPVRPVAAKLVQDLDDSSLLRRRTEGDPAWEAGQNPRFANLWSFIADNCDRPGAVMQAWQARSLVVTGSPEATIYMLRALAETAARHVAIIGNATAIFSDALYAEPLARIRSDFPELQITETFAHDAVAPIVFHAAGDSVESGDVQVAPNAWFVGRMRGHLTVGLLGDEPCETLQAWRGSMRPVDDTLIHARIPEQRIALAAAATAFAALGREAGLDVPLASGALHIVDGRSGFEPIMAVHPPVITKELVPEVAVSSPMAAQTEQEEADAFIADDVLFHPLSGIAEQIAEDTPQVPFSIVRLRVFSARDRAVLGEVRGWGFTGHEARRRAIQKALLAYAASAPAIADKVGVLGAGMSPAEAAANARAKALEAAARRTMVAATRAHFTNPSLHKMRQLLELLVDQDTEILIGTDASGAASVVEVAIAGCVVACSTAGHVDTAIIEALGEACVRYVLGSLENACASDLGLPLGQGEVAACPAAWQVDFGFETIAHRYAIAFAGDRP